MGLTGNKMLAIGIIIMLVLVLILAVFLWPESDDDSDKDMKVETRDDALDIVYSNIIDTDDYENIEIFAKENPLVAGQRIEVIWNDTLESQELLTTLDRDAFLFFIDLHPFTLFEHPTIITLVYTDNGEIETFNKGWWPIVDGKDYWIKKGSRDAPGEKLFSKINTSAPSQQGNNTLILRSSRGGTIPGYCEAKDIQKWALAISAGDDIAVDTDVTDDFAELLKSMGYTAQSMKPSNMPNGWKSIQSTLSTIRQNMIAPQDQGYCDEFFFIWVSHGSKRGYLIIEKADGKKEAISGRQLAEELDKTTEKIEGMQLRVSIEACYAGLYIPIFRAEMPPAPHMDSPDKIARDVYIMTSVSADTVSVGNCILWDSFSVDLQDVIGNQGSVDFSTLFNEAKTHSWWFTPQEANWWNDGS